MLLEIALIMSLAGHVTGFVSETDVFTSGKEGYKCYRLFRLCDHLFKWLMLIQLNCRIPALVTLGSNHLVAFAEGRKYSCRYDSLQSQLTNSRSVTMTTMTLS